MDSTVSVETRYNPFKGCNEYEISSTEFSTTVGDVEFHKRQHD